LDRSADPGRSYRIDSIVQTLSDIVRIAAATTAPSLLYSVRISSESVCSLVGLICVYFTIIVPILPAARDRIVPRSLRFHRCRTGSFVTALGLEISFSAAAVTFSARFYRARSRNCIFNAAWRWRHERVPRNSRRCGRRMRIPP